MTTAVMACMRDEAIFMLEWVAFQKVIGFEKIFIVTNACTDATDLIADRLHATGVAHHVVNDDHGDIPPQFAGVSKVLAHPEIKDVDWLFHCDVDEFLNIHYGDGRLSDLLPVINPFDAAAVTWRLFGDSGLKRWEGGLVTEKLVLAAEKPTHFTAMQKTIFRPDQFCAGIDHMPKSPVRDDLRLCNMRGDGLNARALYDKRSSDHRVAFGEEINRKRKFPLQGAQLNHYATRAEDCFLMKNIRGDGVRSRFGKRYFLHSRWHRAANRIDVEDRTILRHVEPLKRLLSQWREDRILADLEAEALNRFSRKRALHLTPERIAEWTNWSAVEAKRDPSAA